MAEIINKHRTILLIGAAQTKYKIGQVSYFTSSTHVKDAYGDCKLSAAFSFLKDFGCPHVFLYNTGGDKDLTPVQTAIKDFDFTYIVPVDIYLSDSYYDREEGRELLVCGKLLNLIGQFGLSTVIMTDKKASLYEDIDNYLADMLAIETRVNSYLSNTYCGNNLIFVGDVLTVGSSHLYLAAYMCMTPLENYPTVAEELETTFDIDINDTGRHSFVYFRKRKGRTTIENLVNFHEKMSPEKMADIDRVLKYISREVDLSKYVGVTYSDSIKLQAEAYLRGFLESITGTLLESYAIDNVWFEKNSAIPGAVTLMTKFSVRPLGCSANCTLRKEA